MTDYSFYGIKDQDLRTEESMASMKQKTASEKNIRKVASAAKRQRTIAHLPKSVRTALGQQGSKVARTRRKTSH